MKRFLAVLLSLCVAASAMVVMASATLTGTEKSWLMVTEVTAYPSAEHDFGQLIEVFNNTEAELDLFDYEIAVTGSRDANLETALGDEKLKGGFYLANEQGKCILQPGELAVLWVVFDETQKTYRRKRRPNRLYGGGRQKHCRGGRGSVGNPGGNPDFPY